MNKQLTILLLLLLKLTTTYAQKPYEPQILILAPNVTRYEPSFEKEMAAYNSEIKKKINTAEREAVLNSPDFKSQPANIQLITKSEIEFAKGIDFFKQASIISGSFLTYRFYEKFPNVLIKLKDAKSNGSVADLKTYAAAENLQYVLNFASIELYRANNMNYAKIKTQLYDNIANSIILDKEYIGDWNNPGFEFTCEDKTINCTLSNALSKALAEVIYTIASNSPTLKRERQLQQERFEVLMKNYFVQPFDKQTLKTIISPLDSNINMDIAYQSVFNADKDKFVAFFAEQVQTQDFKALKDSKKDKNVKIISDKSIKDEGFLNEIPKTYAYIVKGVKYKGKWYHEKSNVTYFNANNLNKGQQEFFNNLQQWNFFTENSTTPNPDFWETELFEKVPDLKKDPKWERYGASMWKTDEINNRPYIGLYEIVANVFKKELAKENAIFEKRKTALFAQHYLSLKSKNPNTYHKISEHSLIYPTDKSIVLNPTLITTKDGQKAIHYFVILANENEVFEWTFFEPKKITDDLYGSEVVDQISGLTDWNFSVDNLNDMEFWKKYVLQQVDGKHKYLTKVR